MWTFFIVKFTFFSLISRTYSISSQMKSFQFFACESQVAIYKNWSKKSVFKRNTFSINWPLVSLTSKLLIIFLKKKIFGKLMNIVWFPVKFYHRHCSKSHCQMSQQWIIGQHKESLLKMHWKLPIMMHSSCYIIQCKW